MKKTAAEIAKIAICVCIIAVLSQISIPFPSGVPLTFQTFAVAFCAWFLGLKNGMIACLCYLAAGACGVPVFAGFNAGIGAILGPTGGFLWGFILLVAGCGIANIIERRKIAALSNEIDKGKSESRKGKIGAGTLLAVWSVSFAGLLLCHVCGLLLRHGRGGGAGNIVGVAALFAQGYAERNRRLLFGEGAELAHEKGTRRINMAHLSFFAYNISYKERIS